LWPESTTAADNVTLDSEPVHRKVKSRLICFELPCCEDTEESGKQPKIARPAEPEYNNCA
jgi:hypothetical protein